MDKNNGKLDKLRIFSGAQLKYIAFLSMLADHVNKALIYPFLSGEGILQRISDAFDILGRIAFPLFAFFLVEGFFKTGNRKKYLAIFKEFWSLLGFSLILTYNGKRGKQNKLFNYCFYPVHLLILGILRIFLKI